MKLRMPRMFRAETQSLPHFMQKLFVILKSHYDLRGACKFIAQKAAKLIRMRCAASIC